MKLNFSVYLLDESHTTPIPKLSEQESEIQEWNGFVGIACGFLLNSHYFNSSLTIII
jgi:hypothetical protein